MDDNLNSFIRAGGIVTLTHGIQKVKAHAYANADAQADGAWCCMATGDTAQAALHQLGRELAIADDEPLPQPRPTGPTSRSFTGWPPFH